MKLALFALALITTPALAQDAAPDTHYVQPDQDWRKWRMRLQIANAADVATTAICLNKGTCREGNPLYGSSPSTGRIIAIKGAVGLGEWVLLGELAKSDPEAAKWVAIVATVVTASIATANLRFAF